MALSVLWVLMNAVGFHKTLGMCRLDGRLLTSQGGFLGPETTNRDWIFLWFPAVPSHKGSRDSAVGIATGYVLDGRGDRVRVPGGARFFPSFMSSIPVPGLTQPPIQWVPEALSPGSEAATAWSWPLTSSYCRGQEYVDLYIHFHIRLHGLLVN
jgi:hypothetical protein